jgi:hypothetical protein
VTIADPTWDLKALIMVAGVVVALLGMVINLGWNWHNFRRTTRLNEANRRSDLARAEIEAVRARIEPVLAEAEDLLLKIDIIFRKHETLHDIRSDMKDFQSTFLVPTLNKLEKRLHLAEQELSSGGIIRSKGWSNLVSDANDRLLQEFDGIYRQGSVEEFVRSKEVIFQTLMGLISNIRVDFREIIHGATQGNPPPEGSK